jgi:hemerythrin
MDKKIIWTDELKVGIKEIDNQHKAFFDFINQLLEECNTNDNIDNSKIKHHISNIRTFAVKHFHAEERLMKEFKYPHYLEHHQKHKEILDKLMLYKLKAANGEANKNDIIKFSYFLVEWFTGQTLNDDMRFTAYLKNKVGFGKKFMLKLKEIF